MAEKKITVKAAQSRIGAVSVAAGGDFQATVAEASRLLAAGQILQPTKTAMALISAYEKKQASDAAPARKKKSAAKAPKPAPAAEPPAAPGKQGDSAQDSAGASDV